MEHNKLCVLYVCPVDVAMGYPVFEFLLPLMSEEVLSCTPLQVFIKCEGKVVPVL